MKRISPGTQIVDARDTIKAIVNYVTNLDRITKRHPLRVGDVKARLDDAWYFMLHKHPVHEFKDRLYRVDRMPLLEFISSEFSPERMESVDIIVSTVAMTYFVIGNHDGEIVWLKYPAV